MNTIDLAYVGRGAHEELVAYIADQQDYYADEGVHVVLRDGCTWDEERLRHGATIGLGTVAVTRSINHFQHDGIMPKVAGAAGVAVGGVTALHGWTRFNELPFGSGGSFGAKLGYTALALGAGIAADLLVQQAMND